MIDLDNIEDIKRLDKSNMLGSIEDLYLQCQQTWSDIQAIQIDDKYQSAENIIVVGMGGSALGPHTVKSLYFDSLKIPLEIINNYHLPAYANEKTLVVLSSNSGSTEEVLQAAKEAQEKKCLIMGMATGKDLARFLIENKYPSYIFDQKYNKSGQPRMSTGYMILGMIGLFHKAGLITISEEEIESITNILKEKNNSWGQKIDKSKNFAKQIAEQFYGKIVLLVGSSFLSGTVHTFNNQLNENSKNFSSYFLIPEMNHHLMEGLGFPDSNKKNLVYLFINSNLYDERIKKRFNLTQDVVRKNGVTVTEFIPKGKTRLEQSFEVLLLGSYIGFYLAMLNNLNPSPIPWVDYFKDELNK
jgi:glucose/mannose-6-phosphate isomerase